MGTASWGAVPWHAMAISELRHDPLSGRWVVISKRRMARPYQFRKSSGRKKDACSFCDPRPSAPKIPVFFPPSDQIGLDPADSNPFFESWSFSGVHEAITRSSSGHTLGDRVSKEDWFKTLSFGIRRSRELRGAKGCEYVLLYEDHGLGFGLSEESSHHPRSEIVALPFVPQPIQKKIQCAGEFFRKEGDCLFCAIIKTEKSEVIRVIRESHDFLAFCPFASESPSEIAIYPKKHRSSFSDLKDLEIKSLASVIEKCLEGLVSILKRPAYHVVFHQAPVRSKKAREFFHWHVAIIPRLGHLAGFEWGSGIFINPVQPEIAAESLRGEKSRVTS